MKKNKTTEKGGFAFLGRKIYNFVILAIVLWLTVAIDRGFNYRMSIVLKKVQDGAVTENWNQYLWWLMLCAVTGLMSVVVKVFVDMQIERITKFEFYNRYQYMIQTRKEACMLKYQMAIVQLAIIIDIGMAVVKSFFTLLIMGIVKMTFDQYIGAMTVVVIGTLLGIWRGKLQKKADDLKTEAEILQQMLVQNYVVSTDVLNTHLKNLDNLYKKRMWITILKWVIIEFPEILKVVVYIMITYNLVRLMDSRMVYGYSNIILISYTALLDVSMNISYVIEDLQRFLEFKKDHRIESLNEFEMLEDETLAECKRNILLDNDKFVMTKGFSAKVSRADESVGSYQVVEDLTCHAGEIVMLEGENGTGKSRAIGIIKKIFQTNVIAYDINTAISLKLAENFPENVNFEILKRLAKGLEISRIPENEDDFYTFEMDKEVNGADMQKLILLQILYLAEVSSNRNIIILDEAFSNISEENVPKVMNFVSSELRRIKSFTIVVSHAHKHVVRENADFIWQMENQENIIKITKK